jgi:uncharacterized protein YcbK (DUF882 family)
MNLNFTISELVASDTATRNNIKNVPDNAELDNLLKLIVFCLQPIRDKLGKPMVVTSGYRCSRLNTLLNGSATSDHCYGRACDFVVNGMSVADVVKFIRNSGVPFKQLIEEHSGSTVWVHISYDPNNLKKQVLKYENGKYITI